MKTQFGKLAMGFLSSLLLICLFSSLLRADDGCVVYPPYSPAWVLQHEPLVCPFPYTPMVPPPVVCEPTREVVTVARPVVVVSEPCPRPAFTAAGVKAFGKLFQLAAEKGVENAMVRGFNASKTESSAADCPPEKPKSGAKKSR